MTALDVAGIDWADLRELRSTFLDRTAGGRDYWKSDELLAAYDRTFGERIGWKWDYVLDELELREWSPPQGPVLDWACGTGIAGRRLLGRFPGVGTLTCSDRSARAESYARSAALESGIEVAANGAPVTVLLSHVLNELDQQHLETLVGMLRNATTVLWVESGDRETARALQAIRDRLIETFAVVAPCTRQELCPLLAEGMQRHWCHHFASAPHEAFTDPGWGRFVSETGVDLRSTPLSFVVLDRRGVPDPGPGALHVIGRPRVSKAEARVFGCDVNGVTEGRLTKRRLPDVYRAARKGRLASLARWEIDGDEVVRWSSW